jgi:FkbM family methyltransferase
LIDVVGAVRMQELNIFTCADRAYEDFAPLFALSCLLSNPQATVEIGLEDVDSFLLRHGPAMQPVLDAAGRGRICLRSVPFRTTDGRKIFPNSVRFLTEPLIRSEYVYISDIDIVTLDRYLFRKHLQHIQRTGLPFSNMIRADGVSLTGLHFTSHGALYPLPDCSDLPLSTMNDEVLLRTVVERRTGQFTIPGKPFRPVHGIHISPNRPEAAPTDGVGWGVSRYVEEWKQFREFKLFKNVRPFLSARVRSLLDTVDTFLRDDVVLEPERNALRQVKKYSAALARWAPGFAPKVVVDVGAGASSFMLRFLMPSATLYALEPSPARFAALTRALEHDTGARTFQVAATGGHGPGEIAHASRVAWLNALHGDHTSTGDAFCDQTGIAAIDFLKIDTEGFDLVALQGFERMLQDRQIDILEVTVCVSALEPLRFTLDAFVSYLAPFRYGVLAVFEKAHDRQSKELVLLDVLFRANRS